MRWLLGVLVVLLIALTFRLGLLAYAMYALLAVMVVSRWLARSWIENLHASRKCNRRTAEVGDSAEVAVTLRNRGWMPVPWVLVEDLLPKAALTQRPPRLKLDQGKRFKIQLLGSRGETKVRYQVDFQMRGYYQIGPLLVESGDLFGLHRRYKILAEPRFVLVYPRMVSLEGYDLVSRRPIGEVRMTHRLFEDPTRIAGVRPYQTGDPLNRVHWRATARSGGLHSKVYEPSSVVGATILLDFHEAGYYRRGEPYRSELAVTAAASIANTVYQMGQQIGLITNGRDAADRIREEGYELQFHSRRAARARAESAPASTRLRPSVIPTRRGVEQLQHIRETLARVELNDGLTCAQMIAESVGRFPRDASVIAILSEASPETALALGNLRRQGYAVTAILILFDDRHLQDNQRRLMGEGIDTRSIKDEAGLSSVCRRMLVR